MGVSLTGVVRPFESQVTTPAPTPAKANPSADRNVVIQCGDNASPRTFTGSFRFYQAYYRIRRPREKPKA